MRFLLLAPLVLVLGAQAALAADAVPAAAQSVAVSASAPPADGEAPKVQCHQESDIGSMRMHKVCTKVLSDAERNALQDTLRQNLPNNNLTHPAAGSGR
jgi:hypothetical protein